jgi:predicted nicotinamide N-methyase
MPFSSELKSYSFGDVLVELFVPDLQQMQINYEAKKTEISFPYWAQIWPAAIGLTEFIIQNTHYVKGKKVLELAAGLGLPSFAAARFADTVYTSDYQPEAVELMRQSIAYHGWKHVHAGILHWKKLPANLEAETLLLSDVNYNPDDFDDLHTMVQQFLHNGTTVLLSSPQRLMAKSFITKLLPDCIFQEEKAIKMPAETVWVTVFVLEKTESY